MNKRAILYLAILIPLAMIFITTGCILWSERGINPDQDFLYLAAESYTGFYCKEQMEYELLPNQPKPKSTTADCNKATLYRYHFKTDQSTRLTRADVAKLKLSAIRTSKDNYKIETYSNDGIDFIWPFVGGAYHPDFYIVKGKYRHRLSISNDPALSNAYSLHFIAWIE